MFNPAEALRDNPALFACYVLFVYFRGRNAVRIEREMRALGYTTFHRRNLYPRGRHPGWIGKYNWQSQFKDEGGRMKAESKNSSSSFIPQPSSFESWRRPNARHKTQPGRRNAHHVMIGERRNMRSTPPIGPAF